MLTVLLSLFLLWFLPVEVSRGSLIPLDVAVSDVGVDLVDSRPQAVLCDLQHRTVRLAGPLNGSNQLWDEYRHISGRASVLVLLFPLVRIVLVQYNGTGHPDKVQVLWDDLPSQGLDFRDAERGEGQQRWNGVAGILDGLDNDLDLFRQQ